jgi:hypothetical protein
VISQVFGGGGLTGSTYANDFVELHNISSVPVSVAGWSVQYASATGSSWQVTALSAAVLLPGSFYLIKEASGGTGGVDFSADATGTINLAVSAGKVALVTTTTALASCSSSTIMDLVGYGTANCAEGVPAPAPSTTSSASRTGLGCFDGNVNRDDFVLGSVQPRNAGSASVLCASGAVNESGAPLEADFCAVQFPTSVSVTPGLTGPMVFGRIFEAGLTEAVGPPVGVTAQLGFGPITVNPEYQPGWTWVSASYSAQVGNEDEFGASLPPVSSGSYRYVYRFSLDGGHSWTYCDNSGAGSNAGLTFDLEDQAVLTASP